MSQVIGPGNAYHVLTINGYETLFSSLYFTGGQFMHTGCSTGVEAPFRPSMKLK